MCYFLSVLIELSGIDVSPEVIDTDCWCPNDVKFQFIAQFKFCTDHLALPLGELAPKATERADGSIVRNQPSKQTPRRSGGRPCPPGAGTQIPNLFPLKQRVFSLKPFGDRQQLRPYRDCALIENIRKTIVPAALSVIVAKRQ